MLTNCPLFFRFVKIVPDVFPVFVVVRYISDDIPVAPAGKEYIPGGMLAGFAPEEYIIQVLTITIKTFLGNG